MSFVIGAVVIIVFLFLALGGLLVLAKQLRNLPKTENIKVLNLNKKYRALNEKALLVVSGIPLTKPIKTKYNLNTKNRTFILNFRGDIMAKAVEQLKEEITVILGIVQPNDEVVLNLESAGGAVHSYGLAAAQLDRLKKSKVKLTVCVDRIAASGGYMLACIADEIVAAPFAILGSIGVVAEIPNFTGLLDKIGVKFYEMTAGEHKRTVTPFVKPTPEGTKKQQEDLTRTHELFKKHVLKYRTGLNIEKVATGETWYGSEAIENGLADTLGTSDDVIQDRLKNSNVFQLEYQKPKKPMRIFSSAVSSIILEVADRVINKIHQSKY
jgi:serine protease SohB